MVDSIFPTSFQEKFKRFDWRGGEKNKDGRKEDPSRSGGWWNWHCCETWAQNLQKIHGTAWTVFVNSYFWILWPRVFSHGTGSVFTFALIQQYLCNDKILGLQNLHYFTSTNYLYPHNFSEEFLMYLLFNSLIIASQDAVIVLSKINIWAMAGEKVSQDRYMPPSYKDSILMQNRA